MLFNSYEFIFGFLPVTYAVYFLAARLDQRLALLWLGGASIFFYGWWNWMYVPLLLGSIAFNFHMGSWLTRLYRGGGNRRVFWALCFGVALNLALLAYYKYAGFLSFSLAGLTGAGVPDFVRSIILPLGISFFTFTQIAFLADAAQGKAADADPVSYVLFVTFFPHLIAGPILHHGEMMPQFRRPGILRPDMARISAGLACFVMGLFKKAVLADNIAPFANAVFDAAAQGAAPTLLESWLGALAYSLQIYFDFSGYTDMALGLAYMIGIRLPMNFNSPYKAASPIEFWRRWHMTLSRFLRDYLYFPLGGNRKGPARRHLNLMITMVLGGLWHGASWTFVVWGTLHGLFLVFNHAWRALSLPRPGQSVSIGLTFLAVTVAWVFFRADSFEAAFTVLGGMAGANGLVLPKWAAAIGALTGADGTGWLSFGKPSRLFNLYTGYGFVCVLLAIVWILPNSRQIMGRTLIALGRSRQLDAIWRGFAWKPNAAWALSLALMAALALVTDVGASQFLYFNF